MAAAEDGTNAASERDSKAIPRFSAVYRMFEAKSAPEKSDKGVCVPPPVNRLRARKTTTATMTDDYDDEAEDYCNLQTGADDACSSSTFTETGRVEVSGGRSGKGAADDDRSKKNSRGVGRSDEGAAAQLEAFDGDDQGNYGTIPSPDAMDSCCPMRMHLLMSSGSEFQGNSRRVDCGHDPTTPTERSKTSSVESGTECETSRMTSHVSSEKTSDSTPDDGGEAEIGRGKGTKQTTSEMECKTSRMTSHMSSEKTSDSTSDDGGEAGIGSGKGTKQTTSETESAKAGRGQNARQDYANVDLIGMPPNREECRNPAKKVARAASSIPEIAVEKRAEVDATQQQLRLQPSSYPSQEPEDDQYRRHKESNVYPTTPTAGLNQERDSSVECKTSLTDPEVYDGIQRQLTSPTAAAAAAAAAASFRKSIWTNTDEGSFCQHQPKKAASSEFECQTDDIYNDPVSSNPHTIEQRGVLAANQDPLDAYFWYFPEADRSRSEALLRPLINEPGSFLVRKSQSGGDSNPYSMSVVFKERVYHLLIRQRPDRLFAVGKEKEEEKVFGTVPELITYYGNNSVELLGDHSKKTVSGKVPLKKCPPK